MTGAVIEARSVAKRYGAVAALAGLDLEPDRLRWKRYALPPMA